VSGLIGDNDSEVFTITGGLKQMIPRKCTCSTASVIPLIPLTSHLISNQPTTQIISQNQQSESVENTPVLNKSQRNTIKRLEALNKIASKLTQRTSPGLQLQLNSTTSLTKSQNQCVVHSKKMQMFVVDIGRLFGGEAIASWQTPIVEFDGAPMDTILYTLDKGIDEIIMFGGMEMEVRFFFFFNLNWYLNNMIFLGYNNFKNYVILRRQVFKRAVTMLNSV